MVALDEEGKTVEVPRLTLENDAEKRHFAAGELRKKLRQESLEKVRALNIDVTEEELR
jgi:acyl-CoA hydrolase